MANTNTEDLSNHNLKEPAIRTMENDLRSLKAGASPKDIMKNLPKVPGNLPVDFSESTSAPIPLGEKQHESPVALSLPRFDQGEAGVSLRGPIKAADKPLPQPISKPVAEKREMLGAEAQKEADNFSISKADPLISSREKKDSPIVKKEPVKPSLNAVPDIKAERPVARSRVYVKPEEVEILPPEARLAVQSFSHNFDFGKTPKSDNSRPGKDATRLDRYEIVSGERKTLAGSGFSKAGKHIIAIIVLTAVFSGIYYFINLKSNLPAITEGPIPESFIPGISQNTFTVFQKGSGFDMNETIKGYFKGVNVDTALGVSRLVLRENSNNEVKALNISDLESLLKISIPSPVLNLLDKDYNLIVFNYPQKNYLRLGLIFKINDSGALSEQLSAWEPSMFQDMKPLFLNNLILNNSAAGFGSNNYKEASVRYLPLGSADAALNYATDKNKKFFLVATSKDDIFYLIDSVSQ